MKENMLYETKKDYAVLLKEEGIERFIDTNFHLLIILRYILTPRGYQM